MKLNLQPVRWTRQYNGQSPGDLENKNNGFAGRFMGYDNKISAGLYKLGPLFRYIFVFGP